MCESPLRGLFARPALSDADALESMVLAGSRKVLVRSFLVDQIFEGDYEFDCEVRCKMSVARGICSARPERLCVGVGVGLEDGVFVVFGVRLLQKECVCFCFCCVLQC